MLNYLVLEENIDLPIVVPLCHLVRSVQVFTHSIQSAPTTNNINFFMLISSGSQQI